MSNFWNDTLERLVRTLVQVAAAAVIVYWQDAGSFDAISWSQVVQIALYSAGLALLTALASIPISGSQSASFRGEERE